MLIDDLVVGAVRLLGLFEVLVDLQHLLIQAVHTKSDVFRALLDVIQHLCCLLQVVFKLRVLIDGVLISDQQDRLVHRVEQVRQLS